MANLCIIPARGGSKRIPRKNIKPFLGKPIIAYSIETALNSALFDEVMVSTDDDEIIIVAQKYGANIPFKRSDKNANDFATTVDVIQEVLSMYKKEEREFDYVCCIYPTAPFINAKTLNDGYDKLISEKRVSVFPVVNFSYPIWRGLKIKEDGGIGMVWPEYLDARTQDLKKVYHDAGQWYWLNCRLFESERSLFNSNSGCIHMDEMSVQDIDSDIDWKLAEMKFQLNR